MCFFQFKYLLFPDRFRSIAYPYEARISVRQAKFIILAVWMLALVVGLPILIVMDTKENGSRIQCNEYGWPNANLRGAYTAVSFCLTYAIPLPLIAVFYSIIVFKLHQMSKETSNKEGFRTARAKGRVVKMLMVVVTCYALCFLPYHVVFMWFEFGDARMYRCGSFISYISTVQAHSQIVAGNMSMLLKYK